MPSPASEQTVAGGWMAEYRRDPETAPEALGAAAFGAVATAGEIDGVGQAGKGSESEADPSAKATIRGEEEVLVAEAVPGNEATLGEVDLAVSASAVAAEAAYDPAGRKG